MAMMLPTQPSAMEPISVRRLEVARDTAKGIVGALVDAVDQANHDGQSPAARRAIVEYAARCRRGMARLEKMLDKLEAP